jgi:hypothetical protein
MHTQAQSVLVGPGHEVTALRELFGELLTDPGTVRHIADLIAGADIRYEPGASPLTGRWAPDLVLETASGRTRLAELTRDARPLLLDLTGTLAADALPWRDRVDTVVGRAGEPMALLLRPDCYVAWASHSASPDAGERADLRTALTHWFGKPA